MALNPIPMTTAELVVILRNMVDHLEAHDSMDGSIEYHVEGPPCSECGFEVDGELRLDPRPDCPECEGWGDRQLPQGKDFWVSGLYRIGNSMGQGGMRMIHDSTPSADMPKERA